MRLAKPEETGKLSNMTLKETLNACLNKKPHEEGLNMTYTGHSPDIIIELLIKVFLD